MKKKNPNSYKLRKRLSSNSWSELPPDLLLSVFERLGFADSRRAESVCSSWYKTMKRCLVKKQNHWLILLPDKYDKINKHCCKVFNPEEKGKLYRIRDEGIEFTKSSCLATYGNWLLLLDNRSDFYIWNLFTHEKIDLPPVDSQLGTTIKMKRTSKGLFCDLDNHMPFELSLRVIQSPVFWIDEQTKNYVVIWGLDEWCLVYSKSKVKFWIQIQIPHVYRGRSSMVYKDHKLFYLLNDYHGSGGSCIKLFEFSGGLQTFNCGVPATTIPDSIGDSWWIRDTKVVLTVTGDVLKVAQWVKPFARLWSFHVYKVYSSGCFNNEEQVYSLGQEAILFDLGITVLANDDILGFKRNCIYFNLIYYPKTIQIGIFNVETQKMEETLHKFVLSSAIQRDRVQWFLPS